MIATLLIVAAIPAASFDCAKARTQVEHAICASDELAALDREEARLYRMVLDRMQAQREKLVSRQRDFLQSRNGCVESAAPLEECLRDEYQGDIADLRRVARLEADKGGTSSGPLRFRCDGGYPDVYLTLFDLVPAQGYFSIPKLNEGQPLVADPNGGGRLVGRYSTGMVYEPGRPPRVRLNARICNPVS